MYKNTQKWVLVIGLILGNIVVQAQETKLLIQDKISHLGIENIYFKFDNKAAYSNTSGEISFIFKENTPLYLSHLSYGTLKFEADELKRMITIGIIELEYSSPILLNPVSVYALKEKKPTKALRLENADWVQHDAAQVLQKIPGFSSIKKSGSFGFDPIFRGFKLDQISIINDGALCATAACPNRMDPPSSQIAINQMQEIEVLKGPHSFRYGAAMGAIINFKSASPNFEDKFTPFGRINMGFESNGTTYRTEGQLGFRNKIAQISAVGSYAKGGNYTDGGGTVIPAEFSRGTVGISSDFKINERQILSISANRNFARNTDFPTLPMDLLSDDTWMLQSKYSVSKTATWYTHWQTQAYGALVDHSMGNTLRPLGMTLAKTDAKTQTFGGRTEFTIEPKNVLAYIGLDTKYETIEGNRTREILTGANKGKVFTDFVWQEGEIIRTGAFIDWIQKIGKYRLTLASRLDLVKGKANAPAENFLAIYQKTSNTDINTSASAGISRTWLNNWFTGAWLGRGVRSANITERFINSLPIGKDPYEMMGNPNLKPEANNQLDMVVSYKNSHSKFEVAAFYSLVSNYISSKINTSFKPKFGAPGVRQYINIDKAILYGFEASFQHSWLAKLDNQISIAYTYGKNDVANTPLPEINPMSIFYNIEAKLLKNRLMPYFNARYAAKQTRIDTNFGELATPAFTVLDLGLRLQSKNNIQASIALNNLLNTRYREHLSRNISPTQPLNSVGRSFVANISYTF